MWYQLKIKDNIIDIKNLSNESGILVTIYVSPNGDNLYKEVVAPYEVDFEESKRIPFIDGIYKIKIDRIVNNVVIESVEAIYPYYGMLLKSIVNETEKILCGCECSTCDDCMKNPKEVVDLLMKSFSYYILMSKYYSRFFDAIFNCLRTSISEINNCILINENFIGSSDNKDLLQKLISSLYLSFFYAEYYNTDDENLIKNKFKYNKIIKCISVTNTDIECITKQIENNMGLFSIKFDKYINQPPSVVGDYDAGTVANQAVITLTPAMFTTATVPAYADPENDAPQAIRIDTLATNGAVIKYNGNPVTQGQIITIADLAANMATITGPNMSTLQSSSFNFSVRDTGSMQFTS